MSTSQASRAPLTGALTLSLTGRYRRQGNEAAAAVRLWADTDDVQLTLVDDSGSAEIAIHAYTGWIGTVDLLIGPYSSGLVRAIIPHARDAGQLLWNHGGSADDLAQPGIVTPTAPASTYFHGAIDRAIGRRVTRVLIVQGSGPFARAVADGAAGYAAERDLDARTIGASEIADNDVTGMAVLVAGHFDHDLDLIQRLRQLDLQQAPALIAAVAAGIPAFGQEAGPAADGVFGPAQWWPTARRPRIGPSGTAFVDQYRLRTGREPSYVAAQAAAAGYLAGAAHRLGLTPEDVRRWQTSTLLGDFALDAAWRQTGHHITTLEWRNRTLQPIAVSERTPVD